MGKQAKGTFEVKNWDEKAYSEIGGGAKLTRASVAEAMHGDIEAEVKVEYLMMYPDDKSANFVGLHQVNGKLDGRDGCFVLQVTGKFENGVAQGDWFVVPGSGTEGLSGLQGEGGYKAQEGDSSAWAWTLDYKFD